MENCSECGGDNFDEWWMCADCYMAINKKKLEAIKHAIQKAAFEAGRQMEGHQSQREYSFKDFDDYKKEQK